MSAMLVPLRAAALRRAIGVFGRADGAAEHMSEGEVRLRLHLAERAPASRARTKAAEGGADALRA